MHLHGLDARGGWRRARPVLVEVDHQVVHKNYIIVSFQEPVAPPLQLLSALGDSPHYIRYSFCTPEQQRFYDVQMVAT